IGLLAVRHRILDEPLRHARMIVGWMIFGAASWALSWTVLRQLPVPSIPGVGGPIAAGFGIVQDQWLCCCYIGTLVLLLAERPAWTRRLAPIGLAGRMALTNYMIQAAVLDLLASGYGVALRLRPFAYLSVAAFLFAAEVMLSSVWLSRF